MTPTSLYLAALASAAVPGLDPVSVEPVAPQPGDVFDVAFVQDAEHRRWVVRVPRTPAASAQQEQVAPLLSLLARRAAFAVPVPKGFASTKDGRRAAVHAYIPGSQLDLAKLPPGPGIAAELGRTIALLHNTERALFEEAGLPTYDADDYRERRLAALDRAAGTGRVPAPLLTRWERALEDVSMWRFVPTPVHGGLTGRQVLAHFTDDEVGTGTIKGFTGWEGAKVADPADDFADLVGRAPGPVVDTVLEAYAHTRVDRPDRNLVARARLVGELRLLARLVEAVSAKDAEAIRDGEAVLRELEVSVTSGGGSVPDIVPEATPVRRSPSPPEAAQGEANADGELDEPPAEVTVEDAPVEDAEPNQVREEPTAPEDDMAEDRASEADSEPSPIDEQVDEQVDEPADEPADEPERIDDLGAVDDEDELIRRNPELS